MPLIHLAWRNLWRNGRRTAVTLGAVVLSTVVLIVGQALMQGLAESAKRNATDLNVGEVQVHADGYMAERSFYDALEHPDAIVAAAERAGVAGAPRSYGYGLVAVDSRSAGALFWGVDPERERAAFDLPKHMSAGAFLGAAPVRGVVLGRKLARTLGAAVGDEVVVVVQAADGSLGNELFTVGGILKAIAETVDRSTVILHRADFEALFVSGGRVHEVALNGHDALSLDAVATLARTAAPGDDVRTWRQLLPILSDMLGMMDAALWVFGAVFFLAAGLGVMNTMLMATHERIKEFGILKALGTSPWRIVADVTTESLVLALLGTFLGSIVGLAAAYVLEIYGIDTRTFAGETSFAGVAFDPIWRAALDVRQLWGPVVMLWITCVVAALYPAILAARLDPVEAMRRV